MKGRKLLAGFLSAAMVIGTMALPVFADGEATSVTVPVPTYDWYTNDNDNSYEINSLSDYLGFVNITNGKDGKTQDKFQGKTLTLNCDIDFDGIDFLYVDADGNITADWRVSYFNGTFDGNDKTIKNVKYTILQQDYNGNYGLGVIRNSENGTFKKITVDGVTVVSNSKISFGGLVVGTGKGSNDLGCTFENCHVKNVDVDVNTENGFNSYIGGLAGRIIDASVVKNCSVENFDLYTKNGVNYVGGLCGWWYISNAAQKIGELSGTTVKNFKANVAALGGHGGGASGNFGGIGGMLGYGHGGQDWWPLPITNCHVEGLDLTVNNAEDHSYIGGFVGTSRRKYAAENCSAQGKITASNKKGANVFAGGFAGGANGVDTQQMDGWSNDEKAVTYNNCTATVDIVATGTVSVGGFAGIAGSSFTANSNYHEGLNVEFNGCTAKGTITAEGVAGGFAGNADRGVFTGCDASETTVTGSVSGGFIGSLAKVSTVTAGGTYVADIKSCTGSVAAADFLGETQGIVIKDAVATINDSDYYLDLADAVAEAESDDTVTLLNNASGDGVIVPSGKNITIDLGGYTYNVDGTTVGSAGTETNGFQLLRDSNITIKNGTITSDKAKKLIQNYSNLTLENVTLDGSNLSGTNRYVLSNNNGNTVLTGNTNIIAKEGDFAFDCYYWPKNGYTDGVTVTLGTDFTGKITGKIEMSDDGTDSANAASKQFISISGGTFTTDVSAFLADGYKLTTNADGTYGVVVDEKETEPEILKKSLYVTYSQPGRFDFGSGEVDSIKLSLFAGVDSLNYSEVGFDVTVGEDTQTFPVNVVYGSVKVNMDGEVKTINASEFGKGVNHIFGWTINFPATDAFENASVKWVPYAIRNKVKITGDTFELGDIFPGTLEVSK